VNYGTNEVELKKSIEEGWKFGLELYLHSRLIEFAVTENSFLDIIPNEVNEEVKPGLGTKQNCADFPKETDACLFCSTAQNRVSR